MANRLARETSPYLLQHRDNPVDWYPWGEEALSRARSLDLPILISVGYSACHWCHVMERESFEDPEIAAYMNENFVNIKVDREERPDIDALYMEAVQSITGRGGWPMTVFCDSEAVPFHGGTYFPPEPMGGMPSFRMIVEAVAGTYRSKRDEIRERSGATTEALGALGRLRAGDQELRPELLDGAEAGLMRLADHDHGGFGGAPKFPPASSLEFLLSRGSGRFVAHSLDRMMAGGIYDQVGGGFARYSVDAVWLVPHFEKMLYDNALLARLYLHGWQVFGHQRYRRVCEETLDWALRDMRSPEGGFYAALDADSEGEEGRFYVWTPDEIRSALSGDFTADEADAVITYFGATEYGNFEGSNVLHLPGGPDDEPPELIGRARRKLLEARAGRVRPGLDSKCLTSWNALMITALAEAGAVLEAPEYLAAARECAELVLGRMRDERGRLLRTLTAGEARLNAYLEDHAYLLEALVVLYEATFERRWLDEARKVAAEMIERFGDSEHGGFFTTSSDHESLIARRKDLGDHPIPSGNASAAVGLLRLAGLTGDRQLRETALRTARMYARAAEQHPDSFGHLLQAAQLALEGTVELAIVSPAPPDGADAAAGSDFLAAPQVRELWREGWRGHRPSLVRAGGPEGSGSPELLAGRTAIEGRAAAYVCRDFSCRLPVTEVAALAAQLDQA